MLMPLDMHAHIQPGIAPAELDRLGACVVAVTRSTAEYSDVAPRHDRSVVWGVGCHPGLASAVRSFSAEVFRSALSSAPVVGEIGLDRTARVSIETQRRVLSEIISLTTEQPRLLSIHSFRATDFVIELLRAYRPKGVVLHWWLGNEADTMAAIELGAYFSINAAQVRKWEPLRLVPNERVLLETDHPFGDRREKPPRRPGNMASVESWLAGLLNDSPDAARQLVWQNFGRLASGLSLTELLPRSFQVQLLAAGS